VSEYPRSLASREVLVMNVAEAVKCASLANDEIKQNLPPNITHVRLGVWFSVAVCAHGMRGVMFLSSSSANDHSVRSLSVIYGTKPEL